MAIFRPTHPDIEGLCSSSKIKEEAMSETPGFGTKKSKKSSNKSGDLLSQKLFAPPFSGLPYDNDVDEIYYTPNYFGVHSPCRNWVFLGEITNANYSLSPFLRNRVIVTDRSGRKNIPLFFYPESGVFDFHTLKVGHTIAILFAEQHYFMDGSIGIRIESLDYVKVIPCGLNELAELSKQYSSSKDTCWGCGQESKSLKKCGACKNAWYCNETCQRQDWGKGHKKACKAMADFLFLHSLGFSPVVSTRITWR
uniref:MYND-type domain-containing protein n=1 Tax=Amphimedon queenslandica TaxID=400682 RepID=A0A1X7U948_AMPQE